MILLMLKHFNIAYNYQSQKMNQFYMTIGLCYVSDASLNVHFEHVDTLSLLFVSPFFFNLLTN